MLGWLAELLTTIFGRWLSDNLSRMLVLKALLVFLIVTILPIVLINTFDYILGEIIDASLQLSRNNIDSSAFTAVVNFSGFGAWAASKARVPECLTIITTALSVRWALNFVPFVG